MNTNLKKSTIHINITATGIALYLFLVVFSLNMFGQDFKNGLMVDKMETLACSPQKVDSLNQWIDQNGVDAVFLYVSHRWFVNYPNANDSLLDYYHKKGIAVYAVVSPSSTENQTITRYSQYLEKYDGVFFEFEYWHNQMTFAAFKDFTRGLKNALPDKEMLNYIGWPADTYFNGLRRLKFMHMISPNLAVHMYRKNVDLQYVRNRLTAIDQISGERDTKSSFWILYSSEPIYMGDMLKQKSIAEIHDAFLKEYKYLNHLENINLKGQIWFKASDMVPY